MRGLALVPVLLGCGPGRLVAPDGGTGSPCGRPRDPPRPCRAEIGATVERIVDGDTLDVRVGGGPAARVRLIGIDAPEHDEEGCGAPAMAHLASLAPPGSQLRLRFDAECRDAYGRDLAYAFARTALVNAAMVRDGYAQACPFPPNTTQSGLLACAEDEARSEGSGLWPSGCHEDGCFER